MNDVLSTKFTLLYQNTVFYDNSKSAETLKEKEFAAVFHIQGYS
jgi:hypothetical protein